MSHAVQTRKCQRCGGDLFLEREGDGVYVFCIQCGATYPGCDEGSEKLRLEVAGRSGVGSGNPGRNTGPYFK